MKLSKHFGDNGCRGLENITAEIDGLANGLEQFLDSNAIDNYELADVATFFFLLKERYETLDKAVKRLYHVKNRIDKGILPAKMEHAGTDMIRVPEIARSFSKQEKMSASMADKEATFQWLRDIGQEELIQETVNSGTLASFCRRLMLDEGIEPPEDAVRLTTYYTTGINKYTPKKGAK